jgi:RHS repeat-associated protein
MKTTTKNAVGLTHKQKIFNATGYYADGKYYHYVKNHLGSICMVLESESGNIVQNTSYSASGIPSSTALDEQPYLYNGKEFVEAHGLNEYDSQARMYYATIMRATTMDPLAESNYHISPYAWCNNDPINNFDPDGRSTHTDEEGKVVAVYDDNDLNIYKHSNAQLESWGDVYENHLTSEGAEVMGQSLHAMSFADQRKYNDTREVTHADGMTIDFGSTALGDAIQEVVDSKPSLVKYALNARSKHDWDFKEQAQYKNHGSQISDGVYLSPRDAGNVLAGAIKRQSGLLAPVVQFGYGAYSLAHNDVTTTALLTAGTAVLMYNHPLMGVAVAAVIMRKEDKLTQLSIDLGYKYYGGK